MDSDARATRINRLLDAVELIEQDQRTEARSILRQLIHEDKTFEDAWLWMSVAVDSMDQSVVCLDHVLRINPGNQYAAGALYRLRARDRLREARRSRLRILRDTSFSFLWILIVALMVAMMLTMFGWMLI